jgi:hypothetical protein
MRGRWTQVRVHFRYVTQGGALMEVWRDGAKVLEFRPAQKLASPAYWNAGYLLGYDNSGFDAETDIYIDDVKFFDADPGW